MLYFHPYVSYSRVSVRLDRSIGSVLYSSGVQLLSDSVFNLPGRLFYTCTLYSCGDVGMLAISVQTVERISMIYFLCV